ncbi:MAG: hypothetical protein AAGB34_06930 [Planctomycetota bacterium]
MRPIAVCIALQAIVMLVLGLVSHQTMQEFVFTTLNCTLVLLIIMVCHLGGAIGRMRGLLIGLVFPIFAILVIVSVADSLRSHPMAVTRTRHHLYYDFTDWRLLPAILIVGYLALFLMHRVSLRFTAILSSILYSTFLASMYLAMTWNDGPDRWLAVPVAIIGWLIGMLIVPAPPGSDLSLRRSFSVIDSLQPRRKRQVLTERILADREITSEQQQFIRDITRRLRLNITETRSVVEELIHHCLDDEASRKTTGNLPGSLGDPSTGARLITRAKRRCRPPIWHAWVWTARGIQAALALAFLTYLVNVYRFHTAEPTITTDFIQILASGSASIPEEERSWKSWLELWKEERAIGDRVLATEETGEEYTYSEWGSEPPDGVADAYFANFARVYGSLAARTRQLASDNTIMGWPYGDRKALDTYISEVGISAEEIWEFDQKYEEDHPLYRSVYTIPLPYLAHLRRSTLLLWADAREAVNSADTKRFIENHRAIVRLGEYAGEFPTIVNTMLAISIQNATFEDISDVLSQNQDAFTIKELEKLYAIVEGTREVLPMPLDSVLLAMNDLIQRVYTDNGNGDGILTPYAYEYMADTMVMTSLADGTERHGLPDHQYRAFTGPARATIAARRSEAIAFHFDYIEAAKQYAALMPWERTRETSVDVQVELWKNNDYMFWRYPVNLYLMPAIESLITRSDVLRPTTRTRALIAIELCRYRQDRGRWPNTLTELFPDDLPTWMIDRFDGQPLRYVLSADGPIAYSVGADRDDDGGRWPKHDGLASSWQPEPQSWERANGDWILFRLGSIQPTEQELEAMEDDQ